MSDPRVREAVARAFDGGDARIGWSVRGVTRDAVVALLRPSLPVPIAAFAPVGAVVVVSALRSVTLATQLHRLLHGYLCPIGAVQHLGRLFDVAAVARQGAMGDLHVLVKPRGGARTGRERGGAPRSMTGDTRHAGELTGVLTELGFELSRALVAHDCDREELRVS